MARPSEDLHKNMVKKFIKEYPKKNYSIGETCREVGISRQTYHNWINSEPGFKEVIEAFREDFIDIAEQALLQLNRDLNPQTVIFTLKSLGKKRGYQEQTKIDVTTNGESINHISIEIIKPKEDNGNTEDTSEQAPRI